MQPYNRSRLRKIVLGLVALVWAGFSLPLLLLVHQLGRRSRVADTDVREEVPISQRFHAGRETKQ